MKRLLTFILFYCICTVALFSQGQVHRWSWLEKVDSANYQVVHDITVDTANGWIYVVGGFENNLSSNFGGVTSNGSRDGFISKLDTLGSLIWSFGIGGDNDDEVLTIDIDLQNGDIYVGGYAGYDRFSFRGMNSSSISNSANQYHGGKDAFIARYNSNGYLKWANRDGGHGGDTCFDVCVDNTANGRVVYTGSFESKMELNSSSIDMGPNDGKEHMFIAKRKKSNGDGIWRGYSQGNGNFQRGKALTTDGTYVYLLGEFNKGLKIGTQDKDWFGAYNNLRYSSTLSDPNNSNQSIFYARLKSNDGQIESTNSWFYSIYGSGSDFAGDIKVYNNKLFIGGSVSNNVIFKQGTNDPSVLGNQAFVSIHDLSSGNLIRKNNEPNIGNSTFSMVNSISFTDDYLVVGGRTNGTIRFDGNISNDMTSLGSNDGFVAFYAQDTTFIETQRIAGLGTNEVNSIFGRGKDVFVGGGFGGTANFDDDIQATGQDNETGFVSLLSHRDCLPVFSYAMDTVCSESPVINPNSIVDSDGVFSCANLGLNINSTTGAINPFLSNSNTTYEIVHTTFFGCADTVKLFIDSGYVPSFVNPPSNSSYNTNPTGCGYDYNYDPLHTLSDCGSNVYTQIDSSGYTRGDTFPIGSTMQTWVVSDGYNPNDTAEFTITVIDNVIPEIHFSQDTTYLYTTASTCSALVDVLSLLTYSDNCGNTTSLQVADLSNLNGTNFPASNTPYELIFQVTDQSQNSNKDTIYVYVLDTISPTFNNCINSDTTVYLSSSSCQKNVVFNTISANDACGIQNEVWTLPQNNLFSLDTTSVVYTAIDNNQNEATCSFDVIVVDTITPTFTNCNTDTAKYYLPESSCGVEIIFDAPDAEDNCLYSMSQTYGVISGTTLGIVNLDSLIFQVNDSALNSSTCKMYYQVLDTVSPVFANCPNDTIIKANIELCGKVFSYDALIVNDNCNSTGTVSQIDLTNLSSDSLFPVGTTTQSYSYTDLSNNIATCSFTVNVEIHDSANFNLQNTPTGLCVNSDPLIVLDFIEGYQNGTSYVNGVMNTAYTPGSSELTDTIMYVYGGGSCQNTIVHYVHLYDLQANAGTNDSICGLDYVLSANATSTNVNSYWETNNTYNFIPNSTINNPTVEVNQEGVYSFVWFLAREQCVVSDTVWIHFFEHPTSNPGENQTVEVNEVDLNAIVDYGTGYWEVEESEGVIADSLDQYTTVTNLNLGLNTFMWYVSNGICPMDSATVRIFYDMLIIPNAFSPNNDGINDEFRIKGFELYSDATITILDRWGETIYFTDQPTEAWDGTFKGKDVVNDTYFYILYINEKEYTGYIELRR